MKMTYSKAVSVISRLPIGKRKASHHAATVVGGSDLSLKETVSPD
jgi:hypothetical protein